MKKRKRPDDLEYERRVLEIQNWITQGMPYSLIIRRIVVDNDWCNTRNAKEMAKKAKAAWLNEAKKDLEREIAIQIDQLQYIKLGMAPEYRKTPAGIQTLLMVEKEIIRLKRLYQCVADSKINTDLGEQSDKVTVEIVSSGHPIARSEDEVIL